MTCRFSGLFVRPWINPSAFYARGEAASCDGGRSHLASRPRRTEQSEEHNDEHGIIWPITIAPYHVQLVALRGGEEKADALFESLQEAGLEVLYDDRDETPGVKFNDADLIGIPIRVTVSERSLKDDSVEIKLRHEDEKTSVKFDQAVKKVSELKSKLEDEIAKTVVEVPFKE